MRWSILFTVCLVFSLTCFIACNFEDAPQRTEAERLAEQEAILESLEPEYFDFTIPNTLEECDASVDEDFLALLTLDPIYDSAQEVFSEAIYLSLYDLNGELSSKTVLGQQRSPVLDPFKLHICGKYIVITEDVWLGSESTLQIMSTLEVVEGAARLITQETINGPLRDPSHYIPEFIPPEGEKLNSYVFSQGKLFQLGLYDFAIREYDLVDRREPAPFVGGANTETTPIILLNGVGGDNLTGVFYSSKVSEETLILATYFPNLQQIEPLDIDLGLECMSPVLGAESQQLGRIYITCFGGLSGDVLVEIDLAEGSTRTLYTDSTGMFTLYYRVIVGVEYVYAIPINIHFGYNISNPPIRALKDLISFPINNLEDSVVKEIYPVSHAAVDRNDTIWMHNEEVNAVIGLSSQGEVQVQIDLGEREFLWLESSFNGVAYD